MRLIIVILIAGMMQVSAAGFAQKLTYSKKGATLEQIFTEIRKQTGYFVVYADDKIDGNAKLDVKFKDTELKDVLDVISTSQNLTYSFDDKNISVKAKTPSFLERVVDRLAAIDVHGRVVDAEGKALPGASVKVKATGKAVSTDGNGKFFLRGVEEGAVLVVSFIGYVSKEVAAGKEIENIELELSNNILDQVQVIAYGETTQRLNTGNVSIIKSEDIEKQPVNNPLYALQGRVAGLIITPTTGLAGGAVNLQIRGKNSLNQSSDPLIVVDGLPIQNNITGLGGLSGQLTQFSSFSFINPNDIESIAVLKDADATSIYGSRGANGVILISTKKGRVGQSRIDVNLQTGYGNVPKKMKLLNTSQYLELRKESFANVGFKPDVIPPTLNFNTDLLLWDQNRNTDWQKELIGGTARYNDFQGAISGGSPLIQYIIGGNYHKETTVFPGNNSDKKGNVRLALTGVSPNQKFRVTVNAFYMSDHNTLPNIDFTRAALQLPPNAPVPYASDGSINWELLPSGGQGWDNPYAQLSKTYTANVNNLLANADMQYEILPSLFLKSTFGFNELKGNSFRKSFPFADRSPDQLNLTATSLFNSTSSNNVNIEPQLNYSRQIGSGELDVLFGGTYQSTKLADQFLNAGGFTSDALMNNLSSATSLTGSNHSSEYRYNAIFARIKYNWNNRYLVNLTARRDGSSRFGPGSQFGNFGSGSAAWIFSEEEFLKSKLPFLSYGKLRFSYGTSGNDGIDNYRYLERYRAIEGQDPYQGIKGYVTTGLFNQYYHWESTRKMEFGLELGLFKDRVFFTTSYFRNRSSNQLADYPAPLTAGPGALVFNLPALIQNTGLEFTLHSDNIKGKNFKWSTDFNFTRNRNKLLSFPNFENTSYYYTYEIGQPFSGFERVYDFVGVDPNSGKYLFKTASGEITNNPDDNTRRDGGKYLQVFTDPKFYGGISNSINYKNFSLDVFVQFSKQKGRNPIMDFVGVAGQQTNLPIEYLSRWSKAGDIADFQKLFFNTPNEYSRGISRLIQSNANYVDASFIRIKNMSVSYKIAEKYYKQMHLQGLRFYLQGQNIWTFSKYKGLDPETQSTTALPPLRVFTAGVQMTL
jgi:TonB-linked SusC/RagA family outer membrane protein